MTIAVALACPTAGAVASDMRQILNGVNTDDYPKTFAHSSAKAQVIGVLAGTLFHGATPMTTVLKEVCTQHLGTLDELAECCADRLEEVLPGENGIDVVLVGAADLGRIGPPKIIHIHFASNSEAAAGARKRGDRAINPRPFNWYLGGSGAKDVGDALSEGWNDSTIGDVAKKAVDQAVAKANAPGGDAGCGGSASALTLTFLAPPDSPVGG